MCRELRDFDIEIGQSGARALFSGAFDICVIPPNG
jgi:hypothetical protein